MGAEIFTNINFKDGLKKKKNSFFYPPTSKSSDLFAVFSKNKHNKRKIKS